MAEAAVEDEQNPAGSPASGGDMEALFDLVRGIGAQLDAFGDRLNRVENGQPRFVPARREPPPRSTRAPYVPPTEMRVRAAKNLAKGQQAQGGQWLLDTPEGREKLPPSARPAFMAGDVVRINPDAPIHAGPVVRARREDRDGKKAVIVEAVTYETWRELLEWAGLDPDATYGEVLATRGLAKNYEPKYRVQVSGLTTKDGDGFMESELLPGDSWVSHVA